MVYKWERGGGGLAVTDPELIASLRESGSADLDIGKKVRN